MYSYHSEYGSRRLQSRPGLVDCLFHGLGCEDKEEAKGGDKLIARQPDSQTTRQPLSSSDNNQYEGK